MEIKQDNKLLAFGAFDGAGRIQYPGRNPYWVESLQKTIQIIKENEFFPEDLKKQALETERMHNLYLVARAKFKFAYPELMPKDKIERLKEAFLSAEAKEREAAFRFKEQFLSWYKQQEIAHKGFLEQNFPKKEKDKIILEVQGFFDNIVYLEPEYFRNTPYENKVREFQARFQLYELDNK